MFQRKIVWISNRYDTRYLKTKRKCLVTGNPTLDETKELILYILDQFSSIEMEVHVPI